MTYKYWTNFENKRFEAMWRQGLTKPAIGKALGRSLSAIGHHAKSLGLPNKPSGQRPVFWTNEKLAQIKDRRSAGTWASIAIDFGVSRGAVRTAYLKYRIRTGRKAA